MVFWKGNNALCIIFCLGAIAYNESHVCDVALSPTRAKGHVAERRAAAPRSPSRPAGAAMYIRAVMRSCASGFTFLYVSTVVFLVSIVSKSRESDTPSP